MSGTGALNALIVSAIVVPLPILGVISWWFWKHRHDD